MCQDKEKKIRLRPHHGMCMAYFCGNGYSESFTQNMSNVLQLLEENRPLVLTLSADEICRACPNRRGISCSHWEKVSRYDRGVLQVLGREEGAELSAGELKKEVEEKILHTGLREKICGDCIWTDLCREQK